MENGGERCRASRVLSSVERGRERRKRRKRERKKERERESASFSYVTLATTYARTREERKERSEEVKEREKERKTCACELFLYAAHKRHNNAMLLPSTVNSLNADEQNPKRIYAISG